jgi:uncharacterized membrane protein
MAEGGWSFDEEYNNIAPTNWASGNIIDTFIMSIIIYIFFVLTSKSQLMPNIIMYATIFLIYCINTQRSFWFDRNIINENINNNLIILIYVLSGLSFIIFLYGFINYIFYQKKEYGTKFTWTKFFLLGNKCTNFKR